MLDTHILIYLIKNKPPSVAARISALDATDTRKKPNRLCLLSVRAG